MDSFWFDIEGDIATKFFDRSKAERIKKNCGINSKRREINENWSGVREANDFLHLTEKCDFQGKNKLLDSLLKEKRIEVNKPNRASRFSEEPFATKLNADNFCSSTEAVMKMKSNFFGYHMESQKSDRKENKEEKFEPKGIHLEKSANCTYASEYDSSGVRNEGRLQKGSMGGCWSKKSSQGTVNYPSRSTSTLSDTLDGYSTKSIGRSISRDSDDSVCTEKSINSSTISEKLPDGTDITETENNECCLRKSTSGSKVSEKKLTDVTLTEKNDDGMSEKSRTRMSYLEKSATGSSLQEEITFEKMTSSAKSGIKMLEQKSSSETFKKSHNASRYDDTDSYTYEPFMSPSCTKNPTMRRKDLFLPSRMVVSEKISKLIDEAVHQDDLFKIPISLQTDLDRMTVDIFNSKIFGVDNTETHEGQPNNTFLGEVVKYAEKKEVTRPRRFEESKVLNDRFLTSTEEPSTIRYKLFKLISENDSLQQENLKLQSIIQDVTAVNKRWQKYNNERRHYVQKLLSTVQDLQEQINLISEKSAFQRKSNEVDSQFSEIERLKKHHQESLAILELQIKSQKDDWETERKEKERALHEKDEMEKKVHELIRDIKFLNKVLHEERQRKDVICMNCKNTYNQNGIFQSMGHHSAKTPPPVFNCSEENYCTAVQTSYKMTDLSNNNENYFERLNENATCNRDIPIFNISRNELNESSKQRFTRTPSSNKSITSGTIVVEDENGIRLAITEQIPSKDINLKSILKKSDRNINCTAETYKDESKEESISSSAQVQCTNRATLISDDFHSSDFGFGVSTGVENIGSAQATSFISKAGVSNNSKYYLTIGMPGYNVEEICRSKSEPNTRYNSSENLKPLRESSSWNNDSIGVDAKRSVICPDCKWIFLSSTHLNNFDNCELCQSENNQF